MGLIAGMGGGGGEGNDRETLSCPSWSRRELEEMIFNLLNRSCAQSDFRWKIGLVMYSMF